MKQQQEAQPQTAQLYEGMYVLNAHLTDDARNKSFDKIKNDITRRGGEIVKIHDQGRRRLAYEINKQKEGYYYLVYFRLQEDQINELWQEYHLNENLLRFLTMRTDTVLEELKFKQLPEQ
jgi:small subunit ribosomal protein S6